jgi:hypothetical protein
MVAMCGARLKWLTSRMISTLLFRKYATWAIYNARMMVIISFFLTNVEMKQFWLATTFKEVFLLLVHHFAKYVITPLYVFICVQIACIMSCTSRRIWLKKLFI